MSEVVETQREMLLEGGERLEKLDLSGWIVLRNLLAVGEDIVIDWPASCLPLLFDRPVRATVEGVTSNNLLRLSLKTEGAKDDRGVEWPIGPQFGCFDVKWHVWRILK